MKKNLSAAIIVALILFCIPTKNFAQYLNLGKIENTTIFTVNGAVTNTNPSTYNGIISADIGSINNFDANSPNYTVHNNDAFTKQASIDILNAYILLNNVPVTVTDHLPEFSGTITPGVYLIKVAGSATGVVTLDGTGDPNPKFIMKFQGAFTVAANTKIILKGGARAANVFWIAEGAITIGTSCTFVGSVISHPGAIEVGTGTSIQGRMLSTTGAISFGSGNAALPEGASTIPIDCVIDCENTTLGTAANFTLFTGNGALTNTGVSGIIGNIGADVSGSIAGFSSSIVIGNKELTNDVTVKATSDLNLAYTNLLKEPTTIIHDQAYGLTGAGEFLSPGVYSTAGTGSIAGTLTLNGGGNINSIFIFKIGGAFTTAAFSRVVLEAGARRCNIFWVVDGAVTLGALSFMKGNVITNGAISSTGQIFLEGRMLTIAGACNFNTSTTYISNSLCAGSVNNNIRVLPIQLTSFTGNCYKQNITLKWTTASEANNKNFSAERSNDGKLWELVGNIAGAGNSAANLNYSLVDNSASNNTTIFYRLKQTDTDNNFKYSKTISVANCGAMKEDNLSFSPNPSLGQFNFIFAGDKRQVSSTEIFNVQGERVYQSNGYQSKINLTNQAAGIYLVRVHLNSKIIVRKIVLSK